MNALDLGDEARARVELNRADQRQTNAVHQLEAKVRALSEEDPNEEEERAEQSEQINQTLAELMEPDGELGKRLATVAALGEYRHLRNPFTDWLHGAFRLATGEANRASDLFRNAVALDGRRNGHIQKDFRVAEEAARSAAGVPRRVWIVHEDGMGPRLDELRLDLPVPTPSGLLYAGIALPEFVAGTPAVGGLEVEAGGVLYRTEPLLNVDRYAATEFRAGYDAIVGKAVASAVVKVIAQAVVHEAADEMEGLLGEILKIGTAVAAAAMTQADTRIWWALPQSINVASLPRPADDRIRIMAGSSSLLADIPLPTAAFVLVTVKTTSASAPPVVHVAAFGGNQMTSGDLGAPLAQDLATVHEEPSPPVARFEAAGADAAPIVLAAADDSAIPWWAPYVTVDRVLKRKGLRRLTFTRARNVGGFTRVVGEFINHSDRKFTALFRFTWLDAAGQPIDSILGDWRAVHALPGTRVHIAGTAPRSDVGDFRVELIAASRRGGSNEPSGGQSHKR